MKNVFIYEVVLANRYTGRFSLRTLTIATKDPNKLLDLAVSKYAETEGDSAEHWRAFGSVSFKGFAVLDPDA